MALVRWALVGLMAVAAAASWIYFTRSGSQAVSRAAASFICPMHPSVLSERPGSCPICGMDLVPIAGAGGSADAGAQPRAAAPAKAAAGKYWCPMHPEVTSDDPNAVCEKCGGMKLVPREQVPGLVPVDVSADRVQLIGMKTAPVLQQKLAPTVRTVGIVTADEGSIVVVTSYISGWVEELMVTQSGEKVRKGQPLARVYSPDLATAQINYLNAIKWVRDQPGGQAPAAAATLESDARARLVLLGISDPDIQELERNRKPLRALNVRAPADGYIGKRNAQVGMYITPGQELFEIADLSTVWVIADVYESEIERVKVGQKSSITMQSLPGQVFFGKVAFIYPVVNPASRTIQVRMDFRNPGLKLRPGMFADVNLDLGAVEGLVIPADALVETGESQYVFVSLPGGRFEPRRVRVGVRSGDRVQVLEGVSAGERVVTTANFLIDSESRLRAAIQGFGGGPEAAAPPTGHAHGEPPAPRPHGGGH
jgi:multidrug efflux pump subunit AcrA (membrane-fusion protein)